MKTAKTKTAFFFIVILSVIILASSAAKAADDTRPLEIVYPNIPGVAVPTTVSSGLPEYVKYIFHFSVFIIGFIILGVLIYNGVQYLSSSGNPIKLAEARNNIISSFLGAVILLSAYLVFNTINPQLTVLKLARHEAVKPVLTPGIYLCNYKVDADVDSLIQKYKSGNADTVIEVAKELKKIIENDGKVCARVRSSGNLKNVFNNSHTYFTIPKKSYNPDNTIRWDYNYGIIFHEKDNQQGKCRLANIYGQEVNMGSNNLNTSRSITLFQKPDSAPDPQKKGIILYQCLSYNDPSLCPQGTTANPQSYSFKPSGDVREIGKQELDDAGMIHSSDDKLKGARSIKIDPENYYFAVLFDKDKNKCEVIGKNDPNLLDQPIGRCGRSCWWILSKETEQKELESCYPCLASMLVIKGKLK